MMDLLTKSLHSFLSAHHPWGSPQTVKRAKFRLEAYAAYLEEQRHQLEAETERITGELLARVHASA
jgi:hypothetical protein